MGLRMTEFAEFMAIATAVATIIVLAYCLFYRWPTVRVKKRPAELLELPYHELSSRQKSRLHRHLGLHASDEEVGDYIGRWFTDEEDLERFFADTRGARRHIARAIGLPTDT